MGRAIDMEKDIDAINVRLTKLENMITGMALAIDDIEDTVESISDTTSKKKNIDIIEETRKGANKNGKEKTNNEGDDASGKQSNSGKTNAVSKTSKS